MKILLISPAGKAGTIQYTHNLANALANLDHTVMLATAVDFELSSFQKHYEVQEVFDRFRPRPVKFLRFLFRLVKFKPDIVHLQGAQHPGVYLILCRILRCVTQAPFVYTPQDVLPNNNGKFHIQSFKLLYKQFAHVFLNANNNQQDIVSLFDVPDHKISVLSIPDLLAFLSTDLQPEKPDIPTGKKVILCFGLIEPRKGIKTLIEAIPEVNAQIPDTLLLIVGKPLESIQPYQDQISQLQLEDVIKLIPEYVDFNAMAGYFKYSDIIVLPYYSGWNSGVISSAFGFKKPVIATDIAGFKDVIDPGKTGLIVPAKDAKRLAKAIITLLNDKKLQTDLTEKAADSIKNNSWDHIAQITQEIYQSISGIIKSNGK